MSKSNLAYKEEDNWSDPNDFSYDVANTSDMFSFLESNRGLIAPSPLQGFTENSPNAVGYITNVRDELFEDGESFSYDELRDIRTSLKTAYAQSDKKASTLSKHRSALAKLSRLESHAQMVEGRSLEDVLDGNDTYMNLTLAHSWIKKQKYTTLHSDEGVDRMRSAYKRVEDLVKNKDLTNGERNAYSRLVEEFDVVEEQASKIVPFRRPSEDVQISFKPTPRKAVGFFSKYVANPLIGLATLFGVATAAITPNVDNGSTLGVAPAMAGGTQRQVIVMDSPKPLTELIRVDKEVLPEGVYRAGKGDTFWKIAEREGDVGRWQEIQRANGYANAKDLKAGDLLML